MIFVSVANSQNLTQMCSVSGLERYFWTRNKFYMFFSVLFWSTNFVYFRDSANEKSSTTFHKGQIKVFFRFISLNITRFRTSIFMSDFLNFFSFLFLVDLFLLKNKNTPPTSLNTRITTKRFTKCLHQKFVVYWRKQGRRLCGAATVWVLWLRCLRRWAWRCCWWHGSGWRRGRRTRPSCWVGHVEGHSHYD